MGLTQKFDGVTCDTTVCVSDLDVNRKYRILKAKRLTTRYGPHCDSHRQRVKMLPWPQQCHVEGSVCTEFVMSCTAYWPIFSATIIMS